MNANKPLSLKLISAELCSNLPTHPCIQSYLSNHLPRLIFCFSSTECSTSLILLYASMIGKVSALPLLQHLKMKELCPEFHEGGRDCLRLKLSPGDTLPVPSMILDERMSYWEVSTTWWEKVEWLRIYSTCKFLQFFFRKYSHKLKWEFKMWKFQKENNPENVPLLFLRSYYIIIRVI